MQDVIIVGLSNSIGGVENYLLNMQAQLKDKARFIFFVEDLQNMYIQRIKSNGGEVVVVPEKKGFPEFFRHMKALLCQRRGKAKIIYMNISNYSREYLAMMYVAKHLKYRVIVHCHAAKLKSIESSLHRFTHKMVKIASLQKVRSCKRLAVSERAGKYLYGEQPFEVLNPGIDVQAFSFSEKIRNEVRKEYACENKYVIGFVGRFVEVKNPQFAIRVIKELCACSDRKEDVLFMMIGDGPLMDKLKAQVEEDKLQDHVLFVGFSNQVSRYLQAMDCLIGTSLSEGMPLGIMEAQASGLSCICARETYPKEIAATELVTMLSLEDGEKTWAEALYHQQKDKNRLERRRHFNSASAICSFDLQTVSEQLYQLFCGCLE